MGADFLIRHGQDYSHLDLRNSYGLYMNAYYNTSYPSGSDTLFGASGFLLHLPLIWAFQPFNAFMLAIATGPAWVLARRLGLEGRWAALAALSATLPALVYGYELIGSVKEICSLPMLLTLGALLVSHRRWLRGPPRGVIPFALVVGAGVSALGVAFGVWVLATAAVLVVVTFFDGQARAQRPERMLLAGVGVLVLLVCAWPTWTDLSGSLRVAQRIASTSNPGNLYTPLELRQVFGVWMSPSYTQVPSGADLTFTNLLIVLTFLGVLLGVVHVIRMRAYALAGWLALIVTVWLGVSAYATTWADAKTLMLTSPVVVLMAWGGVSALRSSSFKLMAPMLASVLVLGALTSDAMQYHNSNLAPTARYEELASLNARFAGKGPTLFADFDEYSMYELRDLDVGGPDFILSPPALAGTSEGHGDPIDIDRAAPSALERYPLIITRRDPAAIRPTSAYRLLWQGVYYQVWGRRPGAAAAIAHVELLGTPAAQCALIHSLALTGSAPGAQLVAAVEPELVRIPLAGAHHPAHWGHERSGLVMSSSGALQAAFVVPHGGAWDLWLQGQIMPTVKVNVDGRQVASIAGQLDGNSLVPDTMTPIDVTLSAGVHRLSIARGGFSFAPGNGSPPVIDGIFLTPVGAAEGTLTREPAGHWRRLCGQRLEWVEVVRSPRVS
jgi:hypothetical protein